MGLGRWTMEVRDLGQSLGLKRDKKLVVVNFIRKIGHFCTENTVETLYHLSPFSWNKLKMQQRRERCWRMRRS